MTSFIPRRDQPLPRDCPLLIQFNMPVSNKKVSRGAAEVISYTDQSTAYLPHDTSNSESNSTKLRSRAFRWAASRNIQVRF